MKVIKYSMKNHQHISIVVEAWWKGGLAMLHSVQPHTKTLTLFPHRSFPRPILDISLICQGSSEVSPFGSLYCSFTSFRLRSCLQIKCP